MLILTHKNPNYDSVRRETKTHNEKCLYAIWGNEPFIFGNKNLDMDAIKVLKTDAPFIADKLSIEKKSYLERSHVIFRD